jgi:hypothetical protein
MWIGCALALAVVLLIRWRALGALAIQEEFVAQGIRGLSATARAWTMIGLWPLVVTLLIWPAHLSMYYGPDVVTAHTASDWQHVLVLGGVALVLLGASALARRGDRRPLAALLWITIAYLPASNLLIPTGQLLAERTLYLPSVGVMMLVAWVIDQAWRVLERSASTQRVRIAIIAPVLLVATLGGIRSHMGARSWRSDEALFRSGIASAPNASHPHYLLGDWYAKSTPCRSSLARTNSSRPTLAFYLSTQGSSAHLDSRTRPWPSCAMRLDGNPTHGRGGCCTSPTSARSGDLTPSSRRRA